MRFLLFTLFTALLTLPALAEDYPNYLSIGGGGYDFDKESHKQSADYRLEYQWGLSLLPEITHHLDGVDRFLQVHPTVGFEGNTHGASYGNAGLNFDVPFLYHGIFTWGEAVGVFGQGNDPRSLGSILEFRTQIELGWRFDNNLKLTGFISHISNAHIFNDDPGAEIVGAYVHVPLSLLGKK
jgi:hypothetical protein